MDPLIEDKISYESFISVYSQPGSILNEGSPNELKNALKVLDKYRNFVQTLFSFKLNSYSFLSKRRKRIFYGS